jgi:hypothetical protein
MREENADCIRAKKTIDAQFNNAAPTVNTKNAITDMWHHLVARVGITAFGLSAVLSQILSHTSHTWSYSAFKTARWFGSA